MGDVIRFSPIREERQEILLNLDGLSSEAIIDLWHSGGSGLRDPYFERAYYRAEYREADEELAALPDDSRVRTRTATRSLGVSNQTIYTWIYQGTLTGTRQRRGRGFFWTVPAHEIKRLRSEQSSRIDRARAWAFGVASGITDDPDPTGV